MARIAKHDAHESGAGDLQWVGPNAAHVTGVAQRDGRHAVLPGLIDGQLSGKSAADLSKRPPAVYNRRTGPIALYVRRAFWIENPVANLSYVFVDANLSVRVVAIERRIHQMIYYGARIGGRTANLFKQQTANAAQFVGAYSGHGNSYRGIVFKTLPACELSRRPTCHPPARRTRAGRRWRRAQKSTVSRLPDSPVARIRGAESGRPYRRARRRSG